MERCSGARYSTGLAPLYESIFILFLSCTSADRPILKDNLPSCRGLGLFCYDDLPL